MKDSEKPKSRLMVHNLYNFRYEELEDLYQVYKCLISDYRDPLLSQINENQIRFDYDTQTNNGKLVIRYKDWNKHWHSIELTVYPQRKINLTINYYFHGQFKSSVKPTRSFVEYFRTELLKLGYDAEDYLKGRRLMISIRYYQIFSSIIDIVRTLIAIRVPLEWYYDNKPLSTYEYTYYELIQMLPKLRREAEFQRWKDVKPENFTLYNDDEYCMIRLDYFDDGLYEMRFQIGCEKGSFCEPAYDKYIDCSYEFRLLTNDREVGEYYAHHNEEYCKLANAIIDIACNWKALFFHSDDGLYISTERQLGFQKFCMMLDFALGLKNDYKADEPLITSNLMKQKEDFESLMGSSFDIVFDEEQKAIFTHGKFRIDHSVLADRELDEYLLPPCPF